MRTKCCPSFSLLKTLQVDPPSCGGGGCCCGGGCGEQEQEPLGAELGKTLTLTVKHNLSDMTDGFLLLLFYTSRI